ncbi:uncharacterized protein BX664DRAFT_344142 [Halteromyces radiatus]|uniref:uncharacterized protein n=1 Tax=Halteromyces radiatus TaxID=101107 RepID=UPI00221F2FE0|nr:uncharacterized protein BX664DRAFT_344142 [Halteromyces radiatus]KAI8076869.1 hypothetical protein BX664DRAFT_344142 [Halteromyces radiatus]
MDLLPDQELENNNHGITLSSSEIQSHHQSIDQSYFNFSPLHPMLPTSMSSSTWHQQQQQQRSQPTVNSSGISPSTDGSSTYMTESVSSSSSYSGYYSTLSNSSSKSRTLPCRSPFSNLDIYALDVREYGLPFPDNSFYFVMQRLSTPAYTNQNWKFVVSELIRVTQPGGFIQLVEIDYNSQNLGPAGQAWQDKLCQVMAKTKKLDPHMASHMDIVLEENGLVNVKKKKISMPFGPWGLDIGVLWQQNLEAFIEASAPALGQALGISSEECKAMWQDFKDELVHVKAFTNVYAVWGQKPLV